MKFSMMRFLDKYLGSLLVILIIVFDFFRSIFSKKLSPDISSILIIKFFGIGSIVNAIPMVERLRKRNPGIRITFMTFAMNREILDIVDMADEVITIDRSSLFRFILHNLKVLPRLLGTHYDACIDLEFFSKYSMLMSYMSGARRRVGFFAHYNLRSHLLTHPVSFNHYKHISRVYLAMAEALVGPMQTEVAGFSLPSMDGDTKKKLSALVPLDGDRPLVVINPNTSILCLLRKWPTEHYVGLIRILLQEYPEYTYVLIGGPGEHEEVRLLYEQCEHMANGNLLNLAGKTDLRTLLALLEACTLFISNDSGPVHLAAGYATKTLAFFGPETPILYRPLNPNARVMFKGLYCSPCINVLDNKSFETCKTVDCLRQISPQNALDTLRKYFL